MDGAFSDLPETTTVSLLRFTIAGNWAPRSQTFPANWTIRILHRIGLCVGYYSEFRARRSRGGFGFEARKLKSGATRRVAHRSIRPRIVTPSPWGRRLVSLRAVGYPGGRSSGAQKGGWRKVAEAAEPDAAGSCRHRNDPRRRQCPCTRTATAAALLSPVPELPESPDKSVSGPPHHRARAAGADAVQEGRVPRIS